MALPLFLIGGAVVRAVGPRIVKEIIKRGGKKISQQAANKITQNPATITNINKIPKPKIRTAAGMKDFKPLSRIVGTRQGRKFGQGTTQPSSTTSGGTKLSKPTQGPGRANVKPERPSLKPERPSLKSKRPNLKSTPKVFKAKPKAPPSRPKTSVPTGGSKFTGFPRRPTPQAPPSRPISRTQRLANVGKAGVATGVVASKMPKKTIGTKSAQAMPTGPMSRPNRNAPNIGMPKPVTKAPSGVGSKRGPLSDMTTRTMPKKFDGSYSKKTQRLVNITIDGKKATYEIPKGMTTKEATSLLKGTVKKKAGGTPSKYKGFSKLPEAVQKKMSPKLAAKYEAGGYLSHAERAVSGKSKIKDYAEKGKPTPGSPKDRVTKKLEDMKKTPKKKIKTKKMKEGGAIKDAQRKPRGKVVPMPKIPPANPKFKGKAKPMPKMPRLHPEFTATPQIKKYDKILLKGGGSVGNGKVARQVKGFGAARKPKK